MSHQRLLNTLASGAVVRYHAAPTVYPKQAVSSHAWGVQVLLLHVAEPGSLTVNLLLEAALHDSGELTTGDIPYTFKRDNPELRTVLHEAEGTARAETVLGGKGFALTEREQALLKVADTLEGLHYCTENEPRCIVRDRWLNAYHHARDKFAKHLSASEWARADAVFHHCGGVGR